MKSSIWQNIILGEVVTLHRGYDLPSRNRRTGVVPIISSSGESGSHNEVKIQAPGVVTGRYGTLGKVFYVTKNFWPLNTTLYVSDFKGNHPRFISYFLESLDIEQYNGAAAVPGLDRNVLHKVQVSIPPLDIQFGIANILSAYDDLIENNTRRIKILEEMAQAIYREWFAHFRFPGHEGVRMIESEMGEVPEGWTVSKLGEACKVVMGQSPESKYYNQRREGMPFHQGVTDFGDRFPVDRVYCTVENRLAVKDDILCSVRAPVGRLNISTKRIVIGRGLCSIRSKTNSQSFLYQQLKEVFKEEDSMGGGTIFKAVTKEEMLSIKILLPPKSVVDSFEQICQPIDRLIETLTMKNRNLRQQRDLLLPRLVSGEIFPQ